MGSVPDSLSPPMRSSALFRQLLGRAGAEAVTVQAMTSAGG
ncbi:hypothetical protein [Actinomyces israelii]|uniref:Uncharacterized protein n=1 Tax=Actinomyces israelii TaxID=1659 RepID=A0ABT4IDJ7_9ACTO|nr:hypothetical protein [Actinomyces israelii]MCZ0859173.1 hypothetical protein [Actinomyces israelii]